MLTTCNSVLNLISINTSLQERPIYVAISGIVWGAGSILGPVIGGSFADSPATWRWVSIPAMFSFKSCYWNLLTPCRPSISTWFSSHCLALSTFLRSNRSVSSHGCLFFTRSSTLTGLVLYSMPLPGPHLWSSSPWLGRSGPGTTAGLSPCSLYSA